MTRSQLIEAGMGKPIARELAILASSQTFTDDDGVMVANNAATFSLRPSRWQTDAGIVVDVQIQCQARGNALVDWQQTAVLLTWIGSAHEPAVGSRTWLRFLDASGAANFHNLPQGKFQVQASANAALVHVPCSNVIYGDFLISLNPDSDKGVSCVIQAAGQANSDLGFFLCEGGHPDEPAECKLVELKRDPSANQWTGRLFPVLSGGEFNILAVPQVQAAGVGKVTGTDVAVGGSGAPGVSAHRSGSFAGSALAWAACGVGLVGLTALLLWQSVKPKVSIQLSDSSGIVMLLQSGELRVEGRQAPPLWLRDRVRELLESGKVTPVPEVASLLAEIDQQANVLGGDDGQVRPLLLEPLSPAIRSAFPIFHWSSVDRATNYNLVVEKSGLKVTNAAVGTATNFAWTEKAPRLFPGETYTWHVETSVGGEPRVSRPAKFHLLATNELAELHRMEEACGKSEIMLTALYEAWGLFDEAIPYLKQVQRSNSGNASVSRMAAELERRASDEPPDDIDHLIAAATLKQRLELLGPSNAPAFTNAIHDLNQRAMQASKKRDFDVALRVNAIATELAAPLANQIPYGFCLITRGQIAIHQEDYTNAVRICGDALKVFANSATNGGLGLARYTLGNALSQAGQNEQARQQFVMCLGIGVRLKDTNLQVLAWSGQGETDRQLGNLTNALGEFNEALALDRARKNQSYMMDDLFNLSNVQLQMGNEKAALSNLTECFNYYKQTNDLDGQAFALQNIAGIQQTSGDFVGASNSLQLSLEIRRNQKGPKGISVALNNIGLWHLGAGQARAAMPWFEESAAVARTNHEWGSLAEPLNNLGIAYQKLGNFNLAWSNLEASLDIETNHENQLGAAQSRAEMATLRELTGDHAGARAAFNAAAQDFRTASSIGDVAKTLFNLAVVDDEMKDYDEARSNLSNSFTLTDPQDQQMIGAISNAFGELALEAGRLDEASVHFQNAWKIATNTGVNVTEPLLGMAEVELRRGNLAQAIDSFDRAKNMAAESGDVEFQSQALTGLGQALRAAGHVPEAIAAFEGAEKVIEQARATILDPSQQIGFHVSHARPYEELAFCLADVHRAEDAWRAVERGRAQTLVEMMRFGGAPLAKAMSLADQAESRRIDADFNLATLRNDSFVADKARSEQDRLEARRELDSARQAYNSFRSEMYRKHPAAVAQGGELTPPDLAALEPILAQSGLAVVEYVLGEDRSKIVVIHNRSNGIPALEFVDLKASRSEIKELARSFSERLAQSGGMSGSDDEDAQKLYDHLIAPISDSIRGNPTLCIIPDEELWRIPFAALEDHKGRVVIDDHAVFYSPSVSALLAMRNLSARHAAQGDPASNGPRLMLMANPTVTANAGVFSQLLGGNTGEVPGGAQQVRDLSNLFGSDVKVFAGADATERNAKLQSGHFRILHFAAHGVFDPLSPLHSGILLGGGDGEDGLFTANEIMELNWNADLVVTASCQTGLGKVQAGEGVWGLSWAMFVAGSPANLLTLWSVNGNSTADFMISFYRNFDGKDDSVGVWKKAEALRRAQLSLRASRYAHPFYWAPFVLIGDGR